ncbi:hypothetical protein GIB67_007417 [Kingdonia uniflora]|uniref:Uncharacterized protein n=1 Tax=Kingdonia uniflora TaxID=39325 RepID=A0A7J7MLX2_9MAGN|nr:hypothetical protein GIB67_007417 [Kingdonia uniflora]
MGVCASSPFIPTKETAGEERPRSITNYLSTTKVIHLDGRLQEFKYPITACHILLQNPKCFLCSLETMYLDSYLPHVPDSEELQLGQIYFVLKQSQSQVPLSLPDLCNLAIKASTSLAKHNFQLSPWKPWLSVMSPDGSSGGSNKSMSARGVCSNFAGSGSQKDRRNRWNVD